MPNPKISSHVSLKFSNSLAIAKNKKTEKPQNQLGIGG